jgi:hypothetical protein
LELRIYARFSPWKLAIDAAGHRTHREIDRAAKPELFRLFSQAATLEDARELLTLLKLIRGHLDVRHDFVQTP